MPFKFLQVASHVYWLRCLSEGAVRQRGDTLQVASEESSCFSKHESHFRDVSVFGRCMALEPRLSCSLAQVPEESVFPCRPCGPTRKWYWLRCVGMHRYQAMSLP